jgi:hypothetical protein
LTLRRLVSNPAAWWAAAVFACVVLLVAAVDNGVYEATSPTAWSFHVVLRKIYSVVAFAVVGFFVARARQLTGRSASAASIGWTIAGYSAVIEVLQYFLDPPPEGLLSNVIDIACGFLGGAIAAWLASRFFKRWSGRPPGQ